MLIIGGISFGKFVDKVGRANRLSAQYVDANYLENKMLPDEE